MTDDGARVSVVITFENAAPFLAEAIASVHAQSFSDWELIPRRRRLPRR